MANFYNQASLSVSGRITNSNITEGELLTQVILTKTALSSDYGPDDNIVYEATIVNNGSAPSDNITITDNLGATSSAGVDIVPLTYVVGTVRYYINGVLQPTPTVVAGPPLAISGINVPAGGVATVIYEARANDFAPRDENASIINTATATGETLCEELSSTATVPTRDEPILTIAKAICPDTITCGDEVIYTFIIQNTGNVPIIATDNLIVSDNFNPALTDIVVKLNGITLTEGVDYNYDQLTGIFSTIAGAITIPAATYTRDPDTGVIITTPGVAILTVSGTI